MVRITIISVSNLSKNYSNIKVIDNISLTINKGEIISIIGPNGCGKSTLLNILSGIDKEFEGTVKEENKGKHLKKGFVFQDVNSSVLPWKDIIENIRLDNEKITLRIIEAILKELKLWSHRKKYPYQLSGGMKQSVAIGRAFVHDCEILFLDEPFSSLDYSMTTTARNNLQKLWNKNKPTIIFVSHEIDETILISDRVILLSKKPARIKKIMTIRLPRPRETSIITSKRFNEYKKIILAHIEDENK